MVMSNTGVRPGRGPESLCERPVEAQRPRRTAVKTIRCLGNRSTGIGTFLGLRTRRSAGTEPVAECCPQRSRQSPLYLSGAKMKVVLNPIRASKGLRLMSVAGFDGLGVRVAFTSGWPDHPSMPAGRSSSSQEVHDNAELFASCLSFGR